MCLFALGVFPCVPTCTCVPPKPTGPLQMDLDHNGLGLKQHLVEPGGDSLRPPPTRVARVRGLPTRRVHARSGVQRRRSQRAVVLRLVLEARGLFRAGGSSASLCARATAWRASQRLRMRRTSMRLFSTQAPLPRDHRFSDECAGKRWGGPLRPLRRMAPPDARPVSLRIL